CGEWIGEHSLAVRIQEGDAITINSRNNIGVPTESGLNDVATALAQESEEDSITGANDSLIIQFESRPQSRHEVVLWSFIQPFRLATDARENESAANQELRDFRRPSLRITRVDLLYCPLDRLGEVGIEATHAAVVALLQRGFELITQAEIQREPLVESPV